MRVLKAFLWIALPLALLGAALFMLLDFGESPEETLPPIVQAEPEPTVTEPEPTPPPIPSPEPTPQPTEPPRANPFSEAPLLRHAAYAHYAIFCFRDEALYSGGDSPRMPAASVIKVFIMYYAYAQIESGELAADAIIGGQRIHSLISLMIQRSDNAATNALIDYFGMEALNRFFLERGFSDTLLQRRMLDTAARSRGFDNYTSTGDVMAFLIRLYENRSHFPYDEMQDIMLGQEIRTKIHLFLPPGTPVASKTGELPDVENDMGLVFTENGVFAIVVLTSGVRDNAAARQAIGQLARDAYGYVMAGQ